MSEEQYDVEVELLNYDHPDKDVKQYLDEHMEQIFRVWWENLGSFSLNKFINVIINKKLKEEIKNAERQ